jgi:hypothetical protein
VYLIFSTFCVLNNSHSKKNLGRYHKCIYIYIYTYVKCPLFLSDFNENLIFLDRFWKNTQISNFTEICPVEVELSVQMDRQTHRRKEGQAD